MSTSTAHPSPPSTPPPPASAAPNLARTWGTPPYLYALEADPVAHFKSLGIEMRAGRMYVCADISAENVWWRRLRRRVQGEGGPRGEWVPRPRDARITVEGVEGGQRVSGGVFGGRGVIVGGSRGREPDRPGGGGGGVWGAGTREGVVVRDERHLPWWYYGDGQ